MPRYAACAQTTETWPRSFGSSRISASAVAKPLSPGVVQVQRLRALVGAGVIDAVAALTWDIPPGPASAPYNVRRLPPPVVEPGPDRRPITAVALVAVGLTLALGLGALARRALSRR